VVEKMLQKYQMNNPGGGVVSEMTIGFK